MLLPILTISYIINPVLSSLVSLPFWYIYYGNRNISAVVTFPKIIYTFHENTIKPGYFRILLLELVLFIVTLIKPTWCANGINLFVSTQILMDLMVFSFFIFKRDIDQSECENKLSNYRNQPSLTTIINNEILIKYKLYANIFISYIYPFYVFHVYDPNFLIYYILSSIRILSEII